ncbi:DUF2628 domain-containing protein [Hyphomicrobium sp. 1Nfss2.1]|uniref:DUF2628 domain-containing protein n=1 Tax=Hyphomicrobium sp. 1Nfss2.1 TaxID=3413936 RepID=UPI003C7E2D51
MVIYTVHEPPNASANRLESAEQLLFVKDGFSWLAALLPAVWLLWKRMWLELIVFIALAGLIVWVFTALGAPDLGNGILFAIQVLFGFEAGNLNSASLERRGWPLVGTVSGNSREDCERRFLEVWLPTHTEIPAAPGVAKRADVPPSWMQTAMAQARGMFKRGDRAPAGTEA